MGEILRKIDVGRFSFLCGGHNDDDDDNDPDRKRRKVKERKTAVCGCCLDKEEGAGTPRCWQRETKCASFAVLGLLLPHRE